MFGEGEFPLPERAGLTIPVIPAEAGHGTLPGGANHGHRFEQAGVSRSVAMKLTGHKTESIYRRYAIVSKSDLEDAVRRLDNSAVSDSMTN